MRVEKPIFVALLLAGVTAVGSTEVVRLSRLKSPPRELTIHRDLFRQGRTVSPTREVVRPVPPPAGINRGADAAVPAREERMTYNVVYEGFIRRGGRLTAIISVNGEYFITAAGEPVMDDLFLKSLDDKRIVILEDGKSREIPFQGVGENEN